MKMTLSKKLYGLTGVMLALLMIVGVTAYFSSSATIKGYHKGVGLAKEASGSLEAIVSGSTNAMDMVQRIAAATEEQSATAEEVTRNMEHISDITKQSSASTSQIKVSAADLARLAAELKETTAWFKLGNGSEQPVFAPAPDQTPAVAPSVWPAQKTASTAPVTAVRRQAA